MPQQTIKTLLEVLDKSIQDFTDRLPEENRRIYNKVLELVKQLEVKDGNIRNNVTNVRLVNKISSELNSIILSDSYLKKVAEFVKVFDTASELNNRYLAATFVEFKPKKVLSEIKDLNIEVTVDQLTENGVGAFIKKDIANILKQNITSGGSYADFTEQIRTALLEADNNALVKYAKQITTDAVHQYNAQYIQSVTNDLGLEWFQYLGSLIRTSRPFCQHMVDKRFFHVSEIPELLKGLVNGVQVPLNKNSGLPEGMFPNTNVSNFPILRGGYQCGHQIYPVSSVVVPKELRERFS